MTDIDYWNTAALDPDVDKKYISDISTEECLKALAPISQVFDHTKEGRLNILDLGCGVGRLAIPIAHRYPDFSVVGIDVSPKMLAISRQRFAEKPTMFSGEPVYNFKSVVGNGKTIDYPAGTFMAVYSVLLFQHLEPGILYNYINQVWRVLGMDGVFRFQFVKGEYHAMRDHNYTTPEMTKMLDDAGFLVQTIDDGLVHPQWVWITARRKNI